MKNIQRILCLVMVITMLFAMGGCRKDKGSDISDLTDASTVESEYTESNESDNSNDEVSPDSSNSSTTSSQLTESKDNNSSNDEGKSNSGSSSQVSSKYTEKNESSKKENSSSNKNTSSVQNSQTQSKVDFKGETVKIILEWQPSDKKGIDASRDRELDRIAQINKKYNVNLVMKKGPSNYNEGIVSSIAAGSPVGNIIRTSGNGNYDFIRAGLCSNLNDAIKESKINIKSSTYNYEAMKAYNVNNNQYIITCVVPQESGGGSLWFYNKDILKELGYKENYITELYKQGKWDWNAVTTLAQQAIKIGSNGSVSRYGIGYLSAYTMIQNMVISNNAQIGSVSKDGSPLCNFKSAPVKQAFEQVYDWATKQQGMVCTDENDSGVSKFGKGEIFLYAGGDTKKIYNTGVNFGAIFPPKGPNANQYIMTGNGGGANYMIPVNYQKQAGKFLVLLDELYAPYSDVSRQDIVKADMINYFSDSDSWKFYHDAAFDKNLKHVSDPFGTFNIQWKDPSFATVCQNLVKGSLTAGALVEKYNDQYQAILDDLFDGYSLTGLK